jgi:Flp pilus assembly pilin Flp
MTQSSWHSERSTPQKCHCVASLFIARAEYPYFCNRHRVGARRDGKEKKMRIMRKLAAFFKNEAGAVTVDWVVLTALVVLLAVGVVTTVRPATNNLAHNIAHALNAIHVDPSN